MESWRGRVALVTGASSGIGAAIAVSLADAGMQVVAVARRLELVEALAQQVTGPGKLYPRRCDVSQHEQISELFHYVKQTLGGVDLMVNNAALLAAGTITSCAPSKEVSMAELDMMLNVNVRATIAFTKLAVDSMRERNSNGHIVFINSIAGHYLPQNGGMLELNAYPATKFAVTALAETVRREFSFTNLGIRTTSISPGAVDTDMVRQIPDLPTDTAMLKSGDIAAAVLYAVTAPQHVNVQEITIHATGEKF